MRNSLLFKLMGAFLLVIAIGAAVISVFTSSATRNAFYLYTTRSGQVWGQRLAPVLAEYYQLANNWQGVDAVLQAQTGGLISATETNGMMMGQGHAYGAGRQAGNDGMMMAGMGQRLLLIDAQGIVISDTLNEWVGRKIPDAELENGTAITVKNQVVGTLIVTPIGLSDSGTPAGEFLASVNQALLRSVLIAGVIAVLLGTVLFLQITAPLRQLKKAAAAIAQGDLSQRVPVRSRDELGELGQTFNHMAESLASAETQRQHLTADVAHELRTPLAAIQGTLEGMQDGVLPLDAEQITALHSETLLLNRLVGDLRLLSLAEAGQLKLEQQEVDPERLIQQVTERIKSQALAKNIRLETDLAAGLPAVWVDSDRITQVLNNLISNALRYTPENGVITVQAVLPESRPGFIQVNVIDSGPGIPAEALPFVFNRFYRADKSRARASGGSGLGLAIVRQLVEAHGGKTAVESPVFTTAGQAGYGTKITFTLPIHSV